MSGVSVKRLPSGYYHVRGRGPRDWSQPPYWPCSENVIRAHAAAGASDEFIRAAIKEAMREHGNTEGGRK